MWQLKYGYEKRGLVEPFTSQSNAAGHYKREYLKHPKKSKLILKNLIILGILGNG